MIESFYAHGKLLITGEYFVLDGANALAVPTKKGQHLSVNTNTTMPNKISWKSFKADGTVWIDATFSTFDFEIISEQTPEAEMLQKIFRSLEILGCNKILSKEGFLFETRLEFPNDWGLGSSSTLISCISQWAKINPYQLLADTFGGSGYDIACATASGPILYTRSKNLAPQSSEVVFHPVFKENIAFVHLGKKMNSREGITKYSTVQKPKEERIAKLNNITGFILHAENISEFQQAIFQHEMLISEFFETEPVKSKYFSDYTGEIKSLGFRIFPNILQ